MKSSDLLDSSGTYLEAVEAIDLIGSKLVGGWKTGIGSYEEQDHDLLELAEQRLVNWLIAGEVNAVTFGDDGAYQEIETYRFSKPFFRIDLAKSNFAWAEDEWADLLISRRDLRTAIDRIRPGNARKPITYDWAEIVCTMWIVALKSNEFRTQAKLIGQVQQIYADRTDIHPDDKELRPIARLILEHLGDRVLSRELSAEQSPSDEGSKST